jgi:Tol biopolymer transport system component
LFRLGTVLLCTALLDGCAGPSFQLSDLSSEPMAFVYRTREESERRAEILARAEEAPAPWLPGKALVRLEDVGDLLGLGRSEAEKRADFLGRMAFLDAPTAELKRLAFAPRGALLYQAPAGGDREHVFEYDLRSQVLRPIARGAHVYRGASYGPDGRIALARFDPREGDAARSRIFVTEPGGVSPRPVTKGPFDTWPVWSPAGDVLIYSSVGEAGSAEIRAIDPLKGGESRLVARGVEPAFSPAGDWVVYSAKRRGRWTIWRARSDGSGKHPIGSSPHDERDPTVSPDGRFIVYVSEENGYQRLKVRPLDGSGDRPLLTSGDGRLPVW